ERVAADLQRALGEDDLAFEEVDLLALVDGDLVGLDVDRLGAVGAFGDRMAGPQAGGQGEQTEARIHGCFRLMGRLATTPPVRVISPNRLLAVMPLLLTTAPSWVSTTGSTDLACSVLGHSTSVSEA